MAEIGNTARKFLKAVAAIEWRDTSRRFAKA
jgi:hypothetical protein